MRYRLLPTSAALLVAVCTSLPVTSAQAAAPGAVVHGAPAAGTASALGACPLEPGPIPMLGCARAALPAAESEATAAPSGPETCLAVEGVNDACPTWVRRFSHATPPGTDGVGNDQGFQVAVSNDGTRVYVAGHALDATGGRDMLTVAYSADGAELWRRLWDSPNHQSETAYGLALSPDDTRVYITGQRCPSNGYCSVQTVALDAADGAVAWAHNYHSGGTDLGIDVAVAPDGRSVYVTGGEQPHAANAEMEYGPRFVTSFLTLALDATTGEQRWRATHTGVYRADFQNLSQARGVEVSPDGSRVYVAGHASGDGEHSNVATTIAYDAATGEQAWLNTYSGDPVDAVRAFGISADGATLLTTGIARTFAQPDCDIQVLKCITDSMNTIAWRATDGVRLWQRKEYKLGDNNALAVDPLGEFMVIAGHTREPYQTGTQTQQITVAYSLADGTKRWQNNYPGSVGQGWANDVAVSRDGRTVHAVGWSGAGAGAVATPRYQLLSLDAATGDRVAASMYSPGANSSVPFSVAAGAGDAVYLTGLTIDNSTTTPSLTVDADALTMRYDVARAPEPVVPEGRPLLMLLAAAAATTAVLARRRSTPTPQRGFPRADGRLSTGQ